MIIVSVATPWTTISLRDCGHNFELYEYNYTFFRQSFVVNCLFKFLSRSRLWRFLLLWHVFISRITTNCILMFMHIRLICLSINFTYVLTYMYRRSEARRRDRQESRQRIRAFPASGATARQDVHPRQRHRQTHHTGGRRHQPHCRRAGILSLRHPALLQFRL